MTAAANAPAGVAAATATLTVRTATLVAAGWTRLRLGAGRIHECFQQALSTSFAKGIVS